MLHIAIPGGEELSLEHLVLDYNGTLAQDGHPLEGVRERLGELAKVMTIHVITADTHGTVEEKLRGYPVHVSIIGAGAQDEAKRRYVEALGVEGCAAMGNGRNDALMLGSAALGVAVLQREGMSMHLVGRADIITTHILDALDLLLIPSRLKATLRS